MNILITNDDGVTSPGLHALAYALRDVGDVAVLAPNRNWSVAGHAKTLDNPLRLQSTDLPDGTNAFTTNGSPADCVVLGLLGALEKPINLVVAGINTSNNLGYDVNYSGTVAAATEAVIMGVPGIAISTLFDEDIGYEPAAKVGLEVVRQVVHRGLPPNTLLNVNVPTVPLDEMKGFEITRQCDSGHHQDDLVHYKDPYGETYYWIGGKPFNNPEKIGMDIGAIANKYISVTPLKIDRTSNSFVTDLNDWMFEVPNDNNEC
ncbi:MAG TPA: 5'/3'-nucleotidase SurE [Chloroflexi bacterium]|nr:5'/3'-nucleotidase SurE [Chloroflexota bacterium]|tara:strand:- start:1166 stop:1948 length:783 start_codon:yes stop_codon:yes gene_type:complete